MKITSIKKVAIGGLLEKGEHLTIIASVVPATPSGKDNTPWSDVTKQFKVTFEEEESGKIISKWYNIQGYQRKSDFDNGLAPQGHRFASSQHGNEEYLINKKSMERVVSVERTAEAMKILGELVSTAGIAEGEEIEITDLVGKSIGVMVRDGDKSPEVHYTMIAEAIEVA